MSKGWDAEGDVKKTSLSNSFINDRLSSQRPFSGPYPSQPLVPPPLPPRPQTSSPYGYGQSGPMYGGFYGAGSYMSPYTSNSMYGAGSFGYGGYPSFRMFPGFGNGPESSSSPFQTVESVVRAISSLSMMMESTYQSMFTSFRAVLGVAENMERLRRVFVDLFGSLAIIRSFVWLAKKILYILGLTRNNPLRESLWEAAAAEAATVGSQVARDNHRTWPLVAFFGLMLGGPYILSKLVAQPDEAKWDPRKDGVRCVALYDFDTAQRGELPFRRGEMLVRNRDFQGGWALAINNQGTTGYVPVDRLKPINNVMPSQQMKKPSTDQPTASSNHLDSIPSPIESTSADQLTEVPAEKSAIP